MKRKRKQVIHDGINLSAGRDFTQIPNELLRNPEISAKAKALLCLLLSNKEGWKSYMITIQRMMKEGEVAIRAAISELEVFGYLRRLKYRDKATKVWKGGFWAYTDTPNEFHITNQLDFLDQNGWEIPDFKNGNPHRGNPDVGFLDRGNPGLIILNNKNINDKKTNGYSSTSSIQGKGISPKDFSKFWELYPSKRGSKGAALTSWEKLCRKPDRPTWNRIERAIKKQLNSEQWQNTQFIPHGSTWLNQKRWLDDPTQLKGYNFEDGQKEEPETRTWNPSKLTAELTPEEKAENIAKYGTPTPWLDNPKK